MFVKSSRELRQVAKNEGVLIRARTTKKDDIRNKIVHDLCCILSLF